MELMQKRRRNGDRWRQSEALAFANVNGLTRAN